MKSKNFVIYIDRLKDGQTYAIDEESPSDFLDISENELSFPSPVMIRGKAYLADDHLVLQLDIRTQFSMPCSICNGTTTLPIEIKNFYHIEPVEEITSHIFDYTELLREDILLQIPTFVECHNGHCPERKDVNTYLKKKTPSPQKEQVHYPFADL